ncbi:signal transduction histidine kinase/DNA-binding response OmpR family regulator/ligand-binding sensor domain-containing protein [Wenyingzhuangia heitensis]|uniref:histidine kinase n=1 Tax=Wenyingzhuangia heitensis TaxID=1487859 RepID=A0ABX0UCS4_9FLAO|nr:ATP-binding protein [Wenyingzhuangia heitensis]NIJ44941.1 signal transduction histidine kinase/DNA-binding response OmpR family regulator/ligand-binding sensor domain-containing protein [Wenyingzhuangia heitensis]
MRLLYHFLFFLFYFGFNTYAFQPTFHHLTTENGLGSNIVRWVYQDNDGFIWISTKAGLSRYDGYEIKNYEVSNSQKGFLRDMVISEPIELDNRYLLFTSTKGIFSYDKQKDTFQYLSNHLKELNGTKFLTYDDDKNVWTAKNNVGFYKLIYNKDSIQKVDFVNGKQFGFSMRKANMIHTDSQGDVWLFSSGFIAVVRNKTQSIEMVKNWSIGYASFYELSDKNYIITDTAGFYYSLNPKTLEITPYQNNFTKNRDIRHNFKSVFLDTKTILGISRRDGLFYLTHNSEKKQISLVHNFQKQPGVKQALSSNNIRHVFVDKANNAWLSTDGGGVCYFNLKPNKFKHIKYNGKKGGLSDSYISSLYEDKYCNLWVSVWQSDVNVLPAGNSYDNFKYLKNEDITSSKSLGYGTVASFAEFNQHQKSVMLLGTSNYKYLKNYRELNFKNPLIKNLETKSLHRKSRIEDFLIEDETLWICRAELGLEKHTLDAKGNIIKSEFFKEIPKYVELYKEAGQCHYIHKDANGIIWVVHESSVFRIINTNNIYDVKALNIADRLQMMHEDSRGYLWFVTKGKGLIKLKVDALGTIIYKKHFTTQNGFADDFLYAIIEDKENYLWIASNIGLIKLDPITEKYKVYGKGDGVFGKNFVERCCVYRKNGEMVFGTTNGMYVFTPEEIVNNTTSPETVITGFYVFDKKMQVGEELFGQQILSSNIIKTKQIEVPYKANVLAFEFAALHFANPNGNKFAYKLEGFDKIWRTSSAKERKITYTNLREGKYTFLVKSANKDGVWDTSPAKIIVTVKPPFRRTLIAYVLYLIGVFLFVLIIWIYYSKRLKMKQALEMERFEKTKIEELSQMKMRFFTNISHEFRTPLSLIKASIESLSERSKEDKKDKEYVKITNRNISILLRLVNQLIDVRRFDQKKMKLEKEETAIVSFVEDTAQSFLAVANKKQVLFEYKATNASLVTEIDQDKIEKVIYNLLSNAFKHTNAKGSVKIEVLIKENIFEIVVTDTGKGIPEKHRASIFERFYQGEKVKSENMGSSGIGLSLTKDFVEMHGGTISFISKENVGTTFTVSIPTTTQNIENKELLTLVQNEVATTKPVSPTVFDPDKKTLLVVEDNLDLREVLCKGLSDLYNIIEAENGEIGVEKCTHPDDEIEIDLVISDVMMPEKNGYQLCQELKTNTETSHIPIILLTAKTADEHKLEGFDKGADAYIEKPFNFELLKAQVKAILDSKQKLRDFYRQFQTEKVSTKKSQATIKCSKKTVKNTLEVSDYDNELMQKIKETIQEKMQEPTFSVEVLAKVCAVSESTLRRKVKALTGESPSSLIRNYKIQFAGELLQQESYTVYSAMHDAGFSNYANFSKLFAKEFGKTPGEYRKEQHPDLKN